MRSNISQGLCDTTQTERFIPINCKCTTYPNNLGPCATFEIQLNGKCVYCDHLLECHEIIKEEKDPRDAEEIIKRVNASPLKKFQDLKEDENKI